MQSRPAPDAPIPDPDVRAALARVEVESNLGDPDDADTPWLADERCDPVRAVRLAAAAIIAELGNAEWPETVAISVLFGSDAEIARMNGDWRGKPAPTNVLSWPAAEVRPPTAPPPFWGDLAFAHGVASREAHERGEGLKTYLPVLGVHGLLHCLGYDHEADDEAEAMERLEARILVRLGLPDPYADT